MLQPIEKEGIEVVLSEIHHGEEHVLQIVAQPCLRVLIHSIITVPTRGRVALQVAEFPNGRGREFHPGLDGFHNIVHTSNNACDILSLLGSGGVVLVSIDSFGVADIVERNAIHIVFLHDFTAKIRYVVRCTTGAGLHEHFGTHRFA